MKAARVVGVACACLLLAAAPPHTQIYGYTTANSDAEFSLEDRFLDIPSSAGALEAAAALAAQPPLCGLRGRLQARLYVRDRFKEAGFDTTMETLTARIDVPKKLILEIGGSGGRVRTAPKIPAYTSIAKRRIIREQQAAADAAAAKLAAEQGINPGTRLRRRTCPACPRSASTCANCPIRTTPTRPNAAVGLPFIAGSADGDVRGSARLCRSRHAGRLRAARLPQCRPQGRDRPDPARLGEPGRPRPPGPSARAQSGAVLYDDPHRGRAPRAA